MILEHLAGGTAPSRDLAVSKSFLSFPEAPLIDRLMSRVADGEEHAVDALYRNLWPPIVAYCAKCLGSESDAEDAAQRSLLSLLEQAPRYDRRRSALAWAYCIAYWECRSVMTSRRRALSRSVSGGSLEAAPDASDPEIVLSELQHMQIAERLLADLSEQDRALLLGSRDLNSLLGQLRPEARRKRKQRILARIREAFSEIVSPGRDA